MCPTKGADTPERRKMKTRNKTQQPTQHTRVDGYVSSSGAYTIRVIGTDGGHVFRAKTFEPAAMGAAEYEMAGMMDAIRSGREFMGVRVDA